MHMGDRGDVEEDVDEPGDALRAPEVEATLQVGPVNRHRANRLHVVVAVNRTQVGEVHGVLGGLLGVALEAEGAERHTAPIGPVGWISGQAPLRLPAADPPPGEDQPQNLLGLEYLQPGGPWRRRKGGGDALAGCIEFESVEWADETALSYRPAAAWPQVGTHVGTNRLGHANQPIVIAPGNDVLPQPGLLDQLFLQDRFAACNEVPPLGKGR